MYMYTYTLNPIRQLGGADNGHHSLDQRSSTGPHLALASSWQALVRFRVLEL